MQTDVQVISAQPPDQLQSLSMTNLPPLTLAKNPTPPKQARHNTNASEAPPPGALSLATWRRVAAHLTARDGRRLAATCDPLWARRSELRPWIQALTCRRPISSRAHTSAVVALAVCATGAGALHEDGRRCGGGISGVVAPSPPPLSLFSTSGVAPRSVGCVGAATRWFRGTPLSLAAPAPLQAVTSTVTVAAGERRAFGPMTHRMTQQQAAARSAGDGADSAVASSASVIPTAGLDVASPDVPENIDWQFVTSKRKSTRVTALAWLPEPEYIAEGDSCGRVLLFKRVKRGTLTPQSQAKKQLAASSSSSSSSSSSASASASDSSSVEYIWKTMGVVKAPRTLSPKEKNGKKVVYSVTGMASLNNGTHLAVTHAEHRWIWIWDVVAHTVPTIVMSLAPRDGLSAVLLSLYALPQLSPEADEARARSIAKELGQPYVDPRAPLRSTAAAGVVKKRRSDRGPAAVAKKQRHRGGEMFMCGATRKRFKAPRNSFVNNNQHFAGVGVIAEPVGGYKSGSALTSLGMVASIMSDGEEDAGGDDIGLDGDGLDGAAFSASGE